MKPFIRTMIMCVAMTGLAGCSANTTSHDTTPYESRTGGEGVKVKDVEYKKDFSKCTYWRERALEAEEKNKMLKKKFKKHQYK